MSHENSFVLGSPVVYRGQDFFGRETELVVSPLEKGIPGFWYWDSLSSKEFSGITPEIVRVKNRRIQLFDQTSLLQVYEHIGVLRFFGLFGLEGLGITGSGWPPYDGRAIGLWKAIKPNCLPVRKSFPLYMVRKSVSFVYDSPRGGRKAFTKISPTLNGQLTLDITRSYPGIGTQQKVFQFPNNELLEKICEAKTLGWPPFLFGISKRLSPIIKWPHHQSIMWPQEWSKEELLNAIVDHAALDLLGALSFLCWNGYFVGHVVSECSGHEADIGAVLLANEQLCRAK